MDEGTAGVPPGGHRMVAVVSQIATSRPEKCHPYPVDVLDGCETALIVFAAEFGGMNDCAWIVDAGVRATCVDINAEKLEAMREHYSDDWGYWCCDAYDYAAEAGESGHQWDVVSLDPFTNHFQKCADNIDAWCKLARRAVIIGTGTDTIIKSPVGWQQTDCVKRTNYQGGVFWTVLEPVPA